MPDGRSLSKIIECEGDSNFTPLIEKVEEYTEKWDNQD